MSDLISTPSQTPSTVSNDAFEALIDLLTSDGIDDNPPHPTGSPPRQQGNVTLRDASGKLDFDKIRLMFASQHAPKRHREGNRRAGALQTLFDDESDSTRSIEPHSPRSTSSSVPSRPDSPQPPEHAPTSGGHRRSSTFGEHPWPARHENSLTEANAVAEAPAVVSHEPLSFDELNAALAGAHEEVRSLRQKYDELHSLVFKRLEVRDPAKVHPGVANTDKMAPGCSNGRVETRNAGSQAQPSTDVPTEISSLSENDAKRALGALVRSLHLAPGAIASLASSSTPTALTSPQHNASSPSSTRLHDVASIARALKFLGTVDELVWRRTSSSSALRTLRPIFSEENTLTLLARLEVWERAVRRSSRI